MRGWYYRFLPEEEPDLETAETSEELVEEEAPVSEPSASLSGSGQEENGSVVFTYYLTAVLPGEYVVEPVNVTLGSQESMIGATSQQETLSIQNRNTASS